MIQPRRLGVRAARHWLSQCHPTGTAGQASSGTLPRRRKSRRLIGLEWLESRQFLAGDPAISEFMALNNTTLADEDGTLADWIELRNTTGMPLDLAGYYLTDNAAALTKWQFPAVTLGNGQHLVVWASGKDRLGTGPLGQYHTNFSLNGGGEYLALVRPDGATIVQEFASDGGGYPQQYGDISYGLAPVTSEEIYFLAPTPGTANGGPTSTNPALPVVINEIMYHPQSENDADEWIELFNAGAFTVQMDGWTLEGGVDLAFPAGTQMDPGDYLIVAANRAQFLANHPTVDPAIVLGGWTGNLSNRYEEIRVENAFGDRIDTVDYAEEGDWGDRVQSPPDPQGYRSWIWSAPHDGFGRSLELVSAAMPNNQGQNWRPSGPTGGSPGAANSVLASNIAPLISDVGHLPVIPRSTDAVTVTADIRDELTTGLTVNVRWRLDRANNSDPFMTTQMFDDGAHGDGLAGDGNYGATIAAQANNAIVEYYVSATDSGARTRTWPGPTDAGGTQGANALYQVDDAFTANWQPGNQIMFRLIMIEDERSDLATIQQVGGVDGSDAQMNGTFIAYDGEGLDTRYRVSIRNRGGTTRTANGTAANYHIGFPHDDTWNNRSAATVNYNFPQNQVLGAAMFQAAGNPAEDATPIQVRVNNANLSQAGNRMHGSYAWLETRGNDFVNTHYPNDSAGNLYAVNDDDGPAGNFDYRGTDFGAYAVSYHKQTNEELADWSDIVQLSDVMSNTPAANIFQAAGTVTHLDEWARHFAVDTLLVNREGGLVTGRGDDYSLYSGVLDPRFDLIPHDLDTLMGTSDGGGFNPNVDIHAGYSQVSGLVDLFNDPQFLRLYHAEILNLLGGVFSATSMGAMMDQLFTGWLPQTVIDTLKNNAAARRSYVVGVLPTALAVTSGLAQLGGFPRTTNSTVNLSGTGHAGKTVSVTVNGTAANWNARTANWTLNTLALNPGVNRLFVRAWDGVSGTGNVVGETIIDVWNDQPGQALTGTISTDRTLTAAAGPHHVTGTVTVAAGATLTVQPGASIFFADGAQLTVNGRLVAEGNANNWIRFTREPNTTANWNGIQFNGTMQDNRISYAVIEWSSPTINSNQGMLGVQNSNLTVDHGYFDHNILRRIRSRDSSLVVRNSIFTNVYPPNPPVVTVCPPPTPPHTRGGGNVSEHIWGGGIPAGGHWIVENNVFGTLLGHNDAIDFDAPPGAGAIQAQILGNTFIGSGDDFTDMTGNVYMEGNRFLNAHRDTYNMDPGQSNSNSSSNGDYTSVRNVYYNVDHATLTKETAFTTFENNTVVSSDFAAIYFNLPGQTDCPPTPPYEDCPGRGGAVDGSIFYDTPVLFSDVLPTTQLSLARSIVPTAADAALGTGNLVVDPNFFNIAGLDFNLGPGSPARGTGPNGIDMGAMVPGGATIGGEPAAVTPLTAATLTVDGPGIISYRYRVNTGAFSAETPIATPISLSGLTNGTYTVHVVGKNAAGGWQADADATASKSWTVQTSGAIPIQVVINEILASNAGAVPLGATRPDVIELYNRGDTAVSLAGLGITDNPNNPAKFVFPAGTTIAARGYLLVYADSLPSQSGELHLGFGLDAEGDGVYLYSAGATAATPPLDSVEFGIQLPNLSIGRLPLGSTGGASGTPWGLAQPTLGGANRSQALGDPRQLRINEWFTGGSFTIGGQTFTDDFIELYNPISLPVGLGGLYLTDNPADDPDKFPVAALSYVAGGGYGVFLADENTDQGANHTSFQLTSERGWLGLFAADQTRIDQVLYPPMLDGTSQGRVPDGGPAYQYFAQPTPGLDSSPPSVPSNLHFTLVSPTRNDIGWDASTDSQTGVSVYRVYRGGLMLATTTLTTYSDTTVESGTSYSYQVSAVNGDGVESGLSAAISSGLDSSPPSTPTGLAGTIAGATQINLTWNASSDPQSGVRNYNVYRNGSLIGSPTTTAFDDTALAAGPTVTYRVSAINNDNIESPHSLALYAAMFQDGVAPTAAYTGTADTWLDGRNPGVNNGTSNFVRFDGDDVGQDQWALVKWDLAGLPADSTITAGAINIFVTNNSSGQVYEIYAVNKNWVENQANFDVYATGQFWDGPGASGAGDKGAAILGTHVSSTLNAMQTSALTPEGVAQLQAWRNGTQPNFGFIFFDPSNTDGVLFNSREATQASTRPLLTVLYTTPPPLDTTPPSVPTNLVASNDGASRITLYWNAASDPDSGIASYNVYRGGVPIGSTTNLTFTDPGRTPGVNYSYTVSAVNNVGLESGQSSPPVAHSIAVDSSPPTVPSGVAATDNGVSQITLAWTAATDAQSGISLYRVYRDGGLVGTSATTTFVDMGLATNVMYSYQVAAVNGQNLEGPLSTPAITHEIEPLPLSLTLGARDSYLPGAPMLVRVEITGSDGLPDRSIWDATATLSSSNPAVTLSTTLVTLRNGVGSALVTPTGTGDFTITASVPSIGIQSSKALTSLAGVAQTNVSGTLTGAQLNWSGVIHVTGNVTVPDGQTLNIAPGTLILVDGAADNRPNLVTNGIVIAVNGTLSALGTAARPITFTSTGPTLFWGEINHSTSDGTSRYAYVDVLHAGHSPGGDHTGHGPAIRSTNSTLDFDHANITDIAGKTMRAQGSNLTFRNSIFARSAMGPETFSTGLLFENSYIFDMLHIYRQDNVNDDDDGIYVHRQGAGQQIRFDGCIVANTEDDGIDHLGADMIVENCIIRDMVNTADDPKGITIIEGTNIIRNTLMVNVDIGISAKGQSGGTPVSNNTLDHVTIVANSIAIQAEDKFGVPGAIINYDVKNSILRALDAVRTDYDPAPILINYSNLTETWPGTGNQTADPLFVSPAANDYRLQPASPAIDAGDPASPLDADGTRTDMGVFPYFHHPRVAEVLVRGTGWTPAMLGRLAADGLGSGGYRVPIEVGPNFTPLPWTNINQIVVRFTEGVSVAQNDLTLAGVNVPSYTFSGFAYDPATFTATWTRTTPIAADKLRLTVNDSILDLTGSPLDGDPGAAYPSGNGAPGGDFSLRFDVLPGDANQNRAVDGNDFQSVLQVAFNGAAHTAYNPRRDFDGNGAINVLDLHAQLSRQGTTLPAGNPPGSPPAPSAVVIARAASRAPTTGRWATLRQSRPSATAVDQAFSQPEESTGSPSSATLRARRGRAGVRLSGLSSYP